MPPLTKRSRRLCAHNTPFIPLRSLVRAARMMVVVTAVLVLGATVSGATFTWTGGTDTTWNTAGNWNPTKGGPPGSKDTAQFSGAATTNLPVWNLSDPTNKNSQIATISIDNSTFAWNIGSSSPPTITPTETFTINLEAKNSTALNVTGGKTTTITPNVRGDNNQTWNIDGAGTQLNLTGALILDNANAITKTGSGRLDVSLIGLTNPQSVLETINGTTRILGRASFATGSLAGQIAASTGPNGPATGDTVGNLIVNSNLSGDPNISWGLAVGATLGGTGHINNVFAWNAASGGQHGITKTQAVPGTTSLAFSATGGTISPGDPTAASPIGTFTIGQNTSSVLTFQASQLSNTGGGRLRIDLDSATTTQGAAQVPNHDLLSVIGGLTLTQNATLKTSNPVLQLNLLGNPIPTGVAIPIVSYNTLGTNDGSGASTGLTGIFNDTFGNTLTNGSLFFDPTHTQEFEILYNFHDNTRPDLNDQGGTVNYIVLFAESAQVPEPSSLALLGLVGGAAGVRWWRRRKAKGPSVVPA